MAQKKVGKYQHIRHRSKCNHVCSSCSDVFVVHVTAACAITCGVRALTCSQYASPQQVPYRVCNFWSAEKSWTRESKEPTASETSGWNTQSVIVLSFVINWCLRCKTQTEASILKKICYITWKCYLKISLMYWKRLTKHSIVDIFYIVLDTR